MGLIIPRESQTEVGTESVVVVVVVVEVEVVGSSGSCSSNSNGSSSSHLSGLTVSVQITTICPEVLFC